MSETGDRRKLSFASMDEAFADAASLAKGDVRTAGKHTFAEILHHLALTNEMVIGDLTPPKLPLPMRLMMPLLRGSILKGPAKPGFKLPKKMEAMFWPQGVVDTQQSLSRFEKSIESYKSKGPLPVHPVFGKASAEQVDNLVRSHAAMHLSFVHPRS